MKKVHERRNKKHKNECMSNKMFEYLTQKIKETGKHFVKSSSQNESMIVKSNNFNHIVNFPQDLTLARHSQNRALDKHLA